MGNYLEQPITVEHSVSLSSLIPRCAFTETHMHTERPITTQRDGMGREVGGGVQDGKHINPWLIHINVWQKPLQYCI